MVRNGDEITSPTMHHRFRAMNAVFNARNKIGLEKGDKGLHALTNAGYGIINGKTTEAFLDIVSNVTACTMGTKSLLTVHSPFAEPLWCALYRKDNGKLFFIKWSEKGFKQQQIDISQEKIFKSQDWKKAASGIIGSKILFSVDALQIIFDTTTGKSAAFSKAVSKQKIEKYS